MLSDKIRSNALGKKDRKGFVDMWDILKLYVSACSNLVQLVPLYAIILSIVLYHYKGLRGFCCSTVLPVVLPSEDDLLAEYVKAIPLLTIDPTLKLKQENRDLKVTQAQEIIKLKQELEEQEQFLNDYAIRAESVTNWFREVHVKLKAEEVRNRRLEEVAENAKKLAYPAISEVKKNKKCPTNPAA